MEIRIKTIFKHYINIQNNCEINLILIFLTWIITCLIQSLWIHDTMEIFQVFLSLCLCTPVLERLGGGFVTGKQC